MLKVDSPQPPMGGEPMPDMGMEPMDNSMPPMDEPPMDGQMPPMENGEEMGNEFDTNFDPGVDADEETDPKKFIQQLAGKLSQSLRKYNDEQPQPDAELAKFVCGMVVAQAIKGLKQEDVDDILKKVQSDEEPELPQDDNQEQSMEGEEIQQEMPMESKHHSNKKKIDELFNSLTNPEDVENNIEKPSNSDEWGFRKQPYKQPF